MPHTRNIALERSVGKLGWVEERVVVVVVVGVGRGGFNMSIGLNMPISNFDHFKSHFYLVKRGFTGVYVIFLISAQKHRLWVLVRTAGSNENPQSMFWAVIWKISDFFLYENFHFLVVMFILMQLKITTTVELQRLEHHWDHGNLFETLVVRATEG